MKLSAFVLAALLSLSGHSFAGDKETRSPHPGAEGPREQRPNVLLILADDLGFSDVGILGSEIRTPNIDALAREGLLLTNYHTGPQCSVSRSMLLTGVDNHVVGFGSSRGAFRRVPILEGAPGYEAELNDRAVTVASLLRQAGYRTYVAGKWDVGERAEDLPPARGFDRSFILVESGASHFADATKNFEHYRQSTYLKNGSPVGQLPQDFYSSKFYTDKVIEFIEQDRSAGRPFFAFLSHTAVHWPLQVPSAWIDRYRGRYDEGWLPVYRQRLRNLQDAGLFGSPLTDAPALDLESKWAALPADEKARQQKLMEIYAAMVEYMDLQIGRLLAYLDDTGLSENTIVIFTSDNGPEGNDVGAIGNTRDWVSQTFDNSRQNIGRQGSYTWLGEGWGRVAATPFKLYKSYISEGGLRVPAIIRLPGQAQPRVSDRYMSVTDIVPTLLDLTGTEPAQIRESQAQMTGRVMSSTWTGETQAAGAHQGWEANGNRAYYMNQWKAELIWPAKGPGRWQLFDLEQDPQTLHDLASEHPAVLGQMIDAWQDYARRNGVIPVDRDYGYGRYGPTDNPGSSEPTPR